jgi:hypothetical protein
MDIFKLGTVYLNSLPFSGFEVTNEATNVVSRTP